MPWSHRNCAPPQPPWFVAASSSPGPHCCLFVPACACVQPWHHLPTREETLSALLELARLSKRAVLLREHPYTDAMRANTEATEQTQTDMVSIGSDHSCDCLLARTNKQPPP